MKWNERSIDIIRAARKDESKAKKPKAPVKEKSEKSDKKDPQVELMSHKGAHPDDLKPG